MRATYLIVLVVFFFSQVSNVDGYRRGDLIQMSKRSRYAFAHEETETKWSELIARHCPRFRAAKSVTLPNPLSLDAVDLNFDYKLAFSFADGTFITPWITLWDGGNRRIATYIEFVFVYSGNDIKEVRASVDYDDQHTGKGFESIWINFAWEEFGEQDIEFGMNFLLIGGFASVVAVMILIVVDVQVKLITSSRPSGSSSKGGPSYHTSFMGELPTLGLPFLQDVNPQHMAPYDATVAVQEPEQPITLTREDNNPPSFLEREHRSYGETPPEEMGSFVNMNEEQPIQTNPHAPMHMDSYLSAQKED